MVANFNGKYNQYRWPQSGYFFPKIYQGYPGFSYALDFFDR